MHLCEAEQRPRTIENIQQTIDFYDWTLALEDVWRVQKAVRIEQI